MNAKMKTAISNVIKEAEHVCVTADIWTGGKRSFFGMTAHIINQLLERVSFALACGRFKGTHSYDRIAERINNILTEYEIPQAKIICAVTDNGSNFVKAFKEFGPHNTRLTTEVDTAVDGDASEEDVDSDKEQSDDDDDEEELQFQTLPQNLTTLPNHHRCASHTLNLMAKEYSIRIPAGEGDKNYTKVFRSTMAKFSALWTKTSSPKSAEIVQRVANTQLRTPNETRWNSTYDAIAKLIKVKAHLDQLCVELNIPKFKKQELEFAEKYQSAMKPIAVAVDILQGESAESKPGRNYMGTLAPSILSVNFELKSMLSNPNFDLVKPLLKALCLGIETRFADIIQLDLNNPAFKNLALTSVSHPYFKLRWVPPEILHSVKMMFLTEAANFTDTVPEAFTAAKPSTSRFFKFPSQQATVQPIENAIELEALQYLQNPDETLQIFDRYPTIKKIFIKFNTPLPSSAPVERLFSYSGMILSPKRRRTQGEIFEQLVLLKYNNIQEATID